jgi:hypothetical protein
MSTDVMSDIEARMKSALQETLDPTWFFNVVDNEDGTYTIIRKDSGEEIVWEPGMDLPPFYMEAMIEYLSKNFKGLGEFNYQQDLKKKPKEEERKSRTRGSLFEKRRPGWVFGGFEKRGMSNWSPEAEANIWIDGRMYSPSQLRRMGYDPANPPSRISNTSGAGAVAGGAPTYQSDVHKRYAEANTSDPNWWKAF